MRTILFRDLPVGARFTTGHQLKDIYWRKSPPAPHYGRTLNAISNGKSAYFVSFEDEKEVLLLEDDPATIAVNAEILPELESDLKAALMYVRTPNIPPSEARKCAEGYLVAALKKLGREAL